MTGSQGVMTEALNQVEGFAKGMVQKQVLGIYPQNSL